MAYFTSTRSIVAGFTAAGFLAVAGCGPTSGSGTNPADQGGALGGGEATTGGEAAAVAYVDARYHYRIDAPGRMTANADGTASFIGPSERLEVTVVSGASAADLSALARADAKSLGSSAPGFRALSSPSSVTLGGYHMTRFSYRWDAGTSSVTGKAIQLTSVRYYAPKDATTVAVITYGIVTDQFDPQGANDLASTFKWL